MSATAKPSRRNSGFHARRAPAGASASSTRCAVPTGTVDLPTTTAPSSGSRSRTSMETAHMRWLRSAEPSPAAWGVPTVMKWRPRPRRSAAVGSAVKRSLPEAVPWASISSRPGSWKGERPEARAWTLSWSMSMPTTSCPRAAMQAAWTAPRYPHPMTVILMGVLFPVRGFARGCSWGRTGRGPSSPPARRASPAGRSGRRGGAGARPPGTRPGAAPRSACGRRRRRAIR